MRKGVLLLIAALGTCWLAFGTSVLTPEGRAHFERGRELYDSGRWSDAQQEFSAVGQTEPPVDAVLQRETDYYLAMCAMELKEEGAAARLRDFLRRYPESVHVNDVEFALASMMCTAGEFEDAAKAFGRVNYRILSPSHREQYDIRMGYIRFQQNDYDEALRYFQEACRLAPTNREYAAALHNLQSTAGGQMPGNPYGAYGAGPQANAVGCSCCDMCAAMMCMDMCCNCGQC